MSKLIVAGDKMNTSVFQDVCNLFGITHDPRECYGEIQGNTAIWGPTIFPDTTSSWLNIMLHDGDVIIEWNNNPNAESTNFAKVLNGIHRRIVFGKINGQYVFLGVYELDVVASQQIGKLVWNRISRSIYIP